MLIEKSRGKAKIGFCITIKFPISQNSQFFLTNIRDNDC